MVKLPGGWRGRVQVLQRHLLGVSRSHAWSSQHARPPTHMSGYTGRGRPRQSSRTCDAYIRQVADDSHMVCIVCVWNLAVRRAETEELEIMSGLNVALLIAAAVPAAALAGPRGWAKTILAERTSNIPTNAAARFSLYPRVTSDTSLKAAIKTAVGGMTNLGLHVDADAVSSLIYGPQDGVFEALEGSFTRAAFLEGRPHVSMQFTVSALASRRASMFPSAPSMPTNGSHILPSHASLASSMSTHCASLVPVRTRYSARRRNLPVSSHVSPCAPCSMETARRSSGS